MGKSQLLGRWIDDEFSKNILPTVYIEFSSKSFQVDGKIINVQFWDTAGQERFNALTRQYYNGAQGAVIVYHFLIIFLFFLFCCFIFFFFSFLFF